MKTYENILEYYDSYIELLYKANELGKQGFKLQLILPNTTTSGSRVAIFIKETE